MKRIDWSRPASICDVRVIVGCSLFGIAVGFANFVIMLHQKGII